MYQYEYVRFMDPSEILRAVTIPKDLSQLVDRLEYIERFVHNAYPKNVFRDNVKLHTLRGVHRLSKLEIEDKKEICRIFFIHDIPELSELPNMKGRDVTAVAKAYELSRSELDALDNHEKNVAKQLLSPVDLIRWHNFELASNCLKSASDNKEGVGYSALIAKVMDAMEGFYVFHFWLHKWAVEQRPSPELFPPENFIYHGFEETKKYKQWLKTSFPFSTSIPLFLLDETENTICNLWKTLPSAEIPEIIQKYL